VSDGLHIRFVRAVARRVGAPQRPGGTPADDAARSDLERVSDLAEERPAGAAARPRPAPSIAPEARIGPSSADGEPAGVAAPPGRAQIAELRALSTHAGERLALYRRRVYLGRGEPRRLAELERIAAGARDRLTRALRRERAKD
jgi:hypothetical protein